MHTQTRHRTHQELNLPPHIGESSGQCCHILEAAGKQQQLDELHCIRRRPLHTASTLLCVWQGAGRGEGHWSTHTAGPHAADLTCYMYMSTEMK